MLLTDAVIRIALRSGHKQSSVPVCQGRWLEPPETDLHVLMVSILVNKEKKKSDFLQFCPKVALGKKNVLLALQEKKKTISIFICDLTKHELYTQAKKKA